MSTLAEHERQQRHTIHKGIKMRREEALVAQGYRCFYCLNYLTRSDATADHVKPQSDRPDHTKDNIVAACNACNSSKGNISASAFRKIIRGRKIPSESKYWKSWFSYRLQKRTTTACKRIMRSVGCD